MHSPSSANISSLHQNYVVEYIFVKYFCNVVPGGGHEVRMVVIVMLMMIKQWSEFALLHHALLVGLGWLGARVAHSFCLRLVVGGVSCY